VAFLNVSSRGFAAYLLNVALSLPLTLLILALRPKVVLVSVPDSYLVLASYLGCALTGARLVVDVRDPQEEIMVREYRKGLSGLFSRACRWVNYSIYRRSHAVVGVTRSLVAMLAKRIGRPVCLAPNGADLEVFKPLDKSVARKRLGLGQGPFLIAYIGGLSSSGYYNLLPLLLAVRRLRRKLDVDMKLVAAGPILDDYIKGIIESFRDELVYLGLLDTKGVMTLLSACDVGVVPGNRSFIFDYAVPVKFYEYVAMGLPSIVVANKEGELAKIVKENSLGLLCEPNDIRCLEEALAKLAKNRSILERFMENSIKFRKFVDRRTGAETLFEIISGLMNK
jgi:glycosyltransferase involved in cell wall biosynthesis